MILTGVLSECSVSPFLHIPLVSEESCLLPYTILRFIPFFGQTQPQPKQKAVRLGGEFSLPRAIRETRDEGKEDKTRDRRRRSFGSDPRHTLLPAPQPFPALVKKIHPRASKGEREESVGRQDAVATLRSFHGDRRVEPEESREERHARTSTLIAIVSLWRRAIC